MVKQDRHFGTIHTFLIKDPIFEDEINMRILGQTSVLILNMELGLRSGGMHRLDPSAPILLRYVKKPIRKVNTLFVETTMCK